MRILMSLVVAFFAFTGVALASDPFAAFYGNSVSVSGAAGDRTVLINEDGTYETVGGASGTWAMEGDQACFTQTEPAAPDAKPYCVSAEARAVGDSWEMTAPDGSTEKATLTAGR